MPASIGEAGAVIEGERTEGDERLLTELALYLLEAGLSVFSAVIGCEQLQRNLL
jgi:hypothetical protein